uniref:Carboxypeptidase n=1 Tax=Acrobeloides nanus TaxID=290746 RepID=A0A914DIQ3_9BILA
MAALELLTLFSAFAALAYSAPAADLVAKLPGLNFQPNFVHYSGYLNAAPTRKIHYWFVRHQFASSTSPVLLWLNGGPGCSSLGGLIEELGPFHVSDNGNTVYENPWAWNKVGHVIFLESPAGVGFSYATDNNTDTDDDQTAKDNYNSLVDFFTNKFPELKNQNFYITGESYAGVYVPTLAVLIANDKTNFPNFKVNELLDQADDLDPYNLYSVCYLDAGSRSKRNFIRNRLFKNAIAKNLKSPKQAATLPLCAQDGNTETYLNRQDVRTALHIPSSVPHWTDCANINYQSQYDNMITQFQTLLHKKVQILVYNGDVDSVCNIIMNEQFINLLGLKVKGGTNRKAWHYNGSFADTSNVGGYFEKFTEGLDFASVRGSGHFVPEDKPRESLQMIYNFIHNLAYSTPVPFSTAPQPLLNTTG